MSDPEFDLYQELVGVALVATGLALLIAWPAAMAVVGAWLISVVRDGYR